MSTMVQQMQELPDAIKPSGTSGPAFGAQSSPTCYPGLRSQHSLICCVMCCVHLCSSRYTSSWRAWLCNAWAFWSVSDIDTHQCVAKVGQADGSDRNDNTLLRCRRPAQSERVRTTRCTCSAQRRAPGGICPVQWGLAQPAPSSRQLHGGSWTHSPSLISPFR
jgi:hypothetical protein